jgi:nitroreductase
MNETINTLLTRRSIRAYKPEQIKEEELQLILKAGQFAPSAINQQSWHFTVVQSKELQGKINTICKDMFLKSGNKMFEDRAKAESFSIFYAAPTFIIVSGDEKAVAPQIDCALALHNMILAAASMEIGSCWIHAVNNLFSTEEGKALKKELGIPEGYTPYCSGAFGYGATEAQAAPRKDSTVNIIR